MKKNFNYVYVTTNLKTGKQYVGDHSATNLNDNYLGSGVALKRAIKKHGRKNFRREILEQFETKEAAFIAQEKWINKLNTLKPAGYNISPKGGHNVTGCISEETKEKIREGNKGKTMSLDAKKKISDATTGENNPMYKYNYTAEQLKHFSKINSEKNNPFYGKKHNLETLSKMSVAAKNRERKKCPYCNMDIPVNLYGRWHGDNCKQIRNI
jgi:group I intron endonuclease